MNEERPFKNYATGEVERIVVTVDTEIPALPSKLERKKKPDEDKFHDSLDKMDDLKDKIWDDFKAFAKEAR